MSAHITLFELKPHAVSIQVYTHILWRKIPPLHTSTTTTADIFCWVFTFAEVLPVRAWAPAAPMHTPPVHIQSHHLRWSSSGSPRISSPSSPLYGPPCPGLEEKDAPLSHCAPDSSHTGAVDKKSEDLRITYTESTFLSFSVPPLFAWFCGF